MNTLELDLEQVKTIESYNQTALQFNATIARLANYNKTYDFLLDFLSEGNKVLDLACGPAQISAYLLKQKQLLITGIDLSAEMLSIARKTIPHGIFKQLSIIEYSDANEYDAVIIGFGLPYLNTDQAKKCLYHAADRIRTNGYLYVSFMEGKGSRLEKTSFGGNNEFRIHYHSKDTIVSLFAQNGLSLIQKYELDYPEPDGKITRDIVLIGQKKA